MNGTMKMVNDVNGASRARWPWLVLLASSLCFWLGSCKVQLTPEEQQARDATIVERDAALARAADLVGERDAALARADAAVAAGEHAVAVAAADAALAAEASRKTEEARAAAAQGHADEIVTAAAERQVGLWTALLDFLPLPMDKEGGKKALGALLVTALFKRPRDLYVKALKGVGRSAVALNPIGAPMAPGLAAIELINALRDGFGAVGLKHTTEDPEELAHALRKVARDNELDADVTLRPRVALPTEPT